MKRMQVLILIGAVVLLSGCGAQTTGKDVTVNNKIIIEQNYGEIHINPDLATKSGDLSQTTENPTNIETPVDLSLTPVTPEQALAGAVEQKTAATIMAKAAEIAGSEDQALGPEDQAPESASAAGYKYSKNYKMQEIYHDGRPFYRLGQPGESFGESILIVGDSDGKEFIVPDTGKDTGDKAQQFFFNGRGEVEHTFDGNASLFWFRGGAESVTVHYNGVD